MRTIIVLVLCVFNCVFAAAQTKYEVTAETNLNVRKYADADAPVLGTIEHGSQVDVYEITDEWAKIVYDNDSAFVSANYLQQIETPTVHHHEDKRGKTASMMIGFVSAKTMLIVILCLSVLLYIIRARNRNTPPTKVLHIANVALYIVVMALELAYMYQISSTSSHIEVIWFCIPDYVGWLWTIIDFILFLAVIRNQIYCLIGIMKDVEYRTGGNTKKAWGLYTLVIGIVALMASLVFYKDAFGYVLAILIVCQLIQVVLIFTGIVPRGGWGDAVVCSVVYMLGVATFVWMFIFFFVLLLAVVAGLIALTIVGLAMSGSQKIKSKKNSSWSSSDDEDDDDESDDDED